MFSLPTIVPPAASTRSTTTASSAGVKGGSREPFDVGTPATEMLSLTPTVRPASGPSAAPSTRQRVTKALNRFSSADGRHHSRSGAAGGAEGVNPFPPPRRPPPPALRRGGAWLLARQRRLRRGDERRDDRLQLLRLARRELHAVERGEPRHLLRRHVLDGIRFPYMRWTISARRFSTAAGEGSVGAGRTSKWP